MSDKGDLKQYWSWGDPVSFNEWDWIMANQKGIIKIWLWGIVLGLFVGWLI